MLEVLNAATLLSDTSRVLNALICPPPMTPGGTASGGMFDGDVSFFFPWVMGDALDICSSCFTK
jgi:hypothetical protein